MIRRLSSASLFAAFFVCSILALSPEAVAQGGTFPGAAGMSAPGGTVPFDNSRLNMTMLAKDAEKDLSPLENPALSVSKLDLKAPGKARHEYDKGLLFLNKKNYQEAVSHLSAAASMYSDFVAAHNALGSSYLGLNENEKARSEFVTAIALDDHLPISHLNLGCAELALKNFPAAESAVKTAASIAPLDMQVLTALTYAELMNHDYEAAIATAHEVHLKKHKDAAIVHFYAANAWYGRTNLKEAQNELQELLREDPKSPAAEQARNTLEQIKREEHQVPVVVSSVTPATVFTDIPANDAHLAPGQLPAQMQKLLQESKEKQEIAEAEAACAGCESRATDADGTSAQPHSKSSTKQPTHDETGYVIKSTVDEVALLFAATDHGNSVSGLTRADVSVRDNRQPPASITGFLSEAELPLRLGVVIDTSDSIAGRFSFEQKAANNFLQKVITDEKDLAFVVGFSNSVLLVQDFTNDGAQLARGVNQLTSAGGTALWDAVSFAADKLAARLETKPVARIVVVISDGEDNSSSVSLKEAIEAAEHGEVLVYTVSTRDNRDVATNFSGSSYSPDAMVGDRALKVLAENTGGTPFFPGSLSSLNHSLNDLQQVIRSRYLISYKPSVFERNGHYRSVDITAHKSGRKLRVYARKGYYAKLDTTADNKL